MPPYLFVHNDVVGKTDIFGLSSEPDVSWAPAPCPKGQITAFVQVAVGYVFNSDPHVDNGGLASPISTGTGCPLYPIPAGTPGVFQDTPRGLTGKVFFTVCRVCLENCTACKGQGKSYMSPWPGFKIVSKGPCVSWWKGDKGDFSDDTFVHSDAPPPSWDTGMNTDFPYAAKGGCFRCYP
jgi:hypothetical protein